MNGIIANKRAGVSFGGAGADLAPSDLQRHYRLAALQRFLGDALEDGRMADGFQENGDDSRLFILDQVVHDIHGRNHGFVTHRNEQAQAYMPRLGERYHRTCQRAALQNDADRAFYERWLNGQAIRQNLGGDIDESVPIWPQHDHMLLAGEVQDALFQHLSLRPHLAEPGCQDHNIGNTGSGGFFKYRINLPRRHHDESEIYRLAYIAESFHRGFPVYHLVIRIDAVDRAGIAEGLEILIGIDRPARPVRGAH